MHVREPVESKTPCHVCRCNVNKSLPLPLPPPPPSLNRFHKEPAISVNIFILFISEVDKIAIGAQPEGRFEPEHRSMWCRECFEWNWFDGAGVAASGILRMWAFGIVLNSLTRSNVRERPGLVLNCLYNLKMFPIVCICVPILVGRELKLIM